MAPTRRYRCIRTCYHAFRRYEIGEVYVPSAVEIAGGLVPRHFVIEESFSKEAVAEAREDDFKRENDKITAKKREK